MTNQKPSLTMLKLIITAAFCLTLLFAGLFVKAGPKPLCNSWYTYKQLVRKGYHTSKFKGRIFITYKVYQQLLDSSKVTNPIK